MSAGDEDPILKAVPPETDHITYLTILEYHLTEARLPSLAKVLQDDALTESIGWDLVHLLTPMLPASQGCLDLIARKGNPREVVIRVTEYLNSLGEDPDDDDGLRTFEGEAERIHLGEMTLDGMPQSGSSRDGKVLDASDEEASHRASDAEQFEALLSMLNVLHPRIKTNVPSRFLATSLPAALRAYRRAIDNSTTLIFIDFVSKLSGRKRPVLPPREPILGSPTVSNVSLPDPEAEVSTTSLPPEEKALVQRLLQAVALEICEDYVASLEGDPAGMSWSSRVRESMFPDKIVPGKRTAGEQYRMEGHLNARDTTMMRMMDLCLLLGLHPKAVLENLVPPLLEETNAAVSDEPESPSEFPTKPSDIPFSITGSMVYLAAYQTAFRLDIDTRFPFFRIQLLPDISRLNQLCAANSPIAESDNVIIDTLIAINLIALVDEEAFKTPLSINSFLKYLEPLAFLSADSPNPEWRYNSHVALSTALKNHPDETVQLKVIEKFLGLQESGPRLLLRGSAMGWLKDRIVNAGHIGDSSEPSRPESIFLDPGNLDTVAPLVFWDIERLDGDSDLHFLANEIAPTLSNIISALNFYYFLISSHTFHARYGLSSSSKTDRAAVAFIDRVRKMMAYLNSLDSEIMEELRGDIMVIEMCLQSIER